MAEELIKKLGLVPYPGSVCEKFHYKDVYWSNLKVKPLSDERAERSASTIIYFLARPGEYGSWRRMKSDETFFHHKGSPVRAAVITPGGALEMVLIGDQMKNDEARYHHTFLANSWFSFCLGEGEEDYGLFSIVVAPGFDLNDVEAVDLAKMIELFPQHKAVINEFSNK